MKNPFSRNKTLQQHTDQIEAHVNALAEHFDTVQVFCTLVGDDGTHSFRSGAGNFYARMGQVKHWVDKEFQEED